MNIILISDLFKNTEKNYDDNLEITVCGWVKTIRNSKTIGFIEINDGSAFKNLQVVFQESSVKNFKEITKLNVGASIRVSGTLVQTPEMKQPFELHAKDVLIEGASTPDYPLQKKRHSLEYLRTIAHLRARTNTFNAVFRVRSETAFAIHNFFHERNFVYAHTPIITASDCEGAGEMFSVTSLDLNNLPKTQDNKLDFNQDFFGKPTSLTVSGQLEAECMAMALGKVYTFGPTFRAEKSYTQRHAAEFWMVEPEVAFADLNDLMQLAEDMLKYVIEFVLEHCKDEMVFFNKFFDNNLVERLKSILESEFEHITYSEAVKILEKNNNKFEFKISFGSDLQTEHEKFLTEQVFKKPIIVTDYPKEIKSFYMRLNDDSKTVAAMDVLVPGIGEIIGGSQREERLDLLINRMNELKLNQDDYWWYLDLRKYGTTVHSGFGLGFERLIMYLTGIQNIRDILPFPRTTGVCDF